MQLPTFSFARRQLATHLRKEVIHDASILSTDFDGVTCPPKVQALVVNQLLGGAPFARSFNSLVTGAASVSWPQASPTSA